MDSESGSGAKGRCRPWILLVSVDYNVMVRGFNDDLENARRGIRKVSKPYRWESIVERSEALWMHRHRYRLHS